MSEAEALVDKIMNDQFSHERDLVTQALEDVNSDNLRSYLKRLTKEPHIAGSKQDEELVEYIKDAWIDMGLDRFNRVLHRLKLENPAPTVITVAGTNGKGSTCRMIEALLLHGGYRVGSTLSPHIWRFNERIRLHGNEASDEEICNAFGAIDSARGDVTLTYFE